MARCGCGGATAGCSCLVQPGNGVAVTGNGGTNSAFKVAARVSADAGNLVNFGTDGGLLVLAAAAATAGGGVVLWDSVAGAVHAPPILTPPVPDHEPSAGYSLLAMCSALRIITHYRTSLGAWVKSRSTHARTFTSIGVPIVGDAGVQQGRWTSPTSSTWRLGVCRTELAVAGAGGWSGVIRRSNGQVAATFTVPAGAVSGTVGYASGISFSLTPGESVYAEFTNVPAGNDTNVISATFLVDSEVI